MSWVCTYDGVIGLTFHGLLKLPTGGMMTSGTQRTNTQALLRDLIRWQRALISFANDSIRFFVFEFFDVVIGNLFERWMLGFVVQYIRFSDNYTMTSLLRI